MGSNAEIIKQLRLIPGIKSLEPDEDGGFQAPGLDFRIRRGAVVEFIGVAAAEYVVEFLVLNRFFVVYWCEKEQRIFPPYLAKQGLDVSSVTFGTYGKNLADATRDILRSDLYDVVVTPNEFDDTDLNRFGRLARDFDTLLLLLGNEKPKISTHIDLQLDVHRGDEKGTFRHKVKRHKHGRV